MTTRKKSKSPVSGLFILVVFLVFILLFTYSSLNLKSIDYGYEWQELIQKQKRLIEEIDLLKAKRAELLNLERVEKIVMERLDFDYPEPDQVIKVFRDSR